MSLVLVCRNDFFAGSHISFGTWCPLNLQIYFTLLHGQLYVSHTLYCKLIMTMIVAYLHHLGYVLPPGALDISNGLLEFEINHAHLKLLVTLCLPASLDSKNAQKIHHINYILLFNAQKMMNRFIWKYAKRWTLLPLYLYLTDPLCLVSIKG